MDIHFTVQENTQIRMDCSSAPFITSFFCYWSLHPIFWAYFVCALKFNLVFVSLASFYESYTFLICHPLLLPVHKLFFCWRRNLIGLPDFAHDKTVLAGIYFFVVKNEKKKKNLVGLVFLKNVPGTETNWTSLSFLTLFFHLFKTGTGFFPFRCSGTSSILSKFWKIANGFERISINSPGVPCTTVNRPTYRGNTAVCSNTE